MSESATEILLLSGPNLNLLGAREPEIYGTETLENHVETAKNAAARHGLSLHHEQSNHEGELIEFIHQATGKSAAIVINAGALTHTSWAIHDALKSFSGPVIEVHLSNPGAREEFRHLSVIAPVADGTISGFGNLGYELAIEAVASLLGRS
ncbi:MAG: type II 3-dehydroquinate dehydratase [Actinobacteria bacterium]|uniref:3-dehydroquinate dehydratase n=1 Tax=freshwater metagenome TaxID=449393 RepID=A0A6J7EQQ9_9ZZZZ|nr:type II 3-dehydroquinate dehydratase [Actinomycetota bacterium]MSX10733.1 type II 3-dehydroquinate dehydratase [Actinomycetota bacterium]MSX68084.1 type II 3-dehydroquinate dehydratase [Actinomycetota bacterium]